MAVWPESVTLTGGGGTLAPLMTGSMGDGDYQGLLKDVYLPGLTDTIYSDDTLAGLIERNSQRVQFSGNRIIHTFKTQRGGGIGAFTEGGSWVPTSSVKGQQGWESIKFLNMFVQATGPALAIAQEGQGSYITLLNELFADTAKNGRNYFERVISGQGDGILGFHECTAAEADDSTGGITTAITIDSTVSASAVPTTYRGRTSGGFFPTQFFWPGQRVDVYHIKHSSAVIGTATNGVVIATTGVANTVSAVTSTGITLGTSLALAGDAIATGDLLVFVTASAYSGSTCLEPNGLFNLVNNTGNIWNIDRATYAYLQSIVKAASSAELSEALLLQWIMELQYQHQADPNLWITTPRAITNYFLNTTRVPTDATHAKLQRFSTMDTVSWTGGYNTMGIQLGGKVYGLTAVGSMPAGSMLCINTNDFAFATASNGFQWVTGGEGAMQQSHSADVKFASAIDYMNFVCFDPARQMKVTGIDDTL